MIELTEEFSIGPCKLYGWILFYTRKSDHPKSKTGETVDEFYYPKISYCLKKALDLSGKDCETIEQLLKKWESIMERIEELSEKGKLDALV